MALMFSRSQISRATLPETRSSAGRHELQRLSDGLIGHDIQICRLLELNRKACFRVPSKTGSPVVFTKSASRMESFSVSFFAPRERQ
jgi:hypothetical protein